MKYKLPATFVKYLGRGSCNTGAISLTIVVPLNVPSLFHSSSPASESTTKNSVLLTPTGLTDELHCLPNSRTKSVPASVPSVFTASPRSHARAEIRQAAHLDMTQKADVREVWIDILEQSQVGGQQPSVFHLLHAQADLRGNFVRRGSLRLANRRPNLELIP